MWNTRKYAAAAPWRVQALQIHAWHIRSIVFGEMVRNMRLHLG